MKTISVFLIMILFSFLGYSQEEKVEENSYENKAVVSLPFGTTVFSDLQFNNTLKENNSSEINNVGLRFGYVIDLYLKNYWFNIDAALNLNSGGKNSLATGNNRLGVGYVLGNDILKVGLNVNYSANMYFLKYIQSSEGIIENTSDLADANSGVLRLTSPISHNIGIAASFTSELGGEDFTLRLGYDFAINSFDWRSNKQLVGFNNEKINHLYIQFSFPLRRINL